MCAWHWCAMLNSLSHVSSSCAFFIIGITLSNVKLGYAKRAGIYYSISTLLIYGNGGDRCE